MGLHSGFYTKAEKIEYFAVLLVERYNKFKGRGLLFRVIIDILIIYIWEENQMVRMFAGACTTKRGALPLCFSGFSF